jgi:hypothetical protein
MVSAPPLVTFSTFLCNSEGQQVLCFYELLFSEVVNSIRMTCQCSDNACLDVSCSSYSTAVLFKAGLEPSTAQRDGSGVSVMPLGTASAAKSASIFDDESDDREPGTDGIKQMRGTAQLSRCVSIIPSHFSFAAPASLPPKKYESLFQEEQDADDL